ncbi:MAG: hypothetical protein H6716_23120 [Polyangiaceae bacterium]|nr:hypothetical protein [Polyangiaceae bacterium]
MHHADEMLPQRVVRCRGQLAHGNTADVPTTLAMLERAGASLAPWRAWLLAELALFSPRLGHLPSAAALREIAQGVEPEEQRACARACFAGQRAAFLAFDRDQVVALSDLGLELSDASAEETRLYGQLCGGWSALMRGDDQAGSASAELVFRAASASAMPELMVESRALAALVALAAGDTPRALELARRASLMARVESLPQPEFLAHLVLARARRFARQPHLSLRIARALQDVVPAPWRTWLDWEWALAGGEQLEASESASSVAMLKQVLGEQPVEPGVLAMLGDQRERLPLPFANDVAGLCGCLQSAASELSAALKDWREGHVDVVPEELHGVAFRSDLLETGGSVARVRAEPGKVGIRLLAHAPEFAGLPQLDTHGQRRVETLLSVLALAGPDGLQEAECFERTYGFAYVAELHAGTFEVLLHRTRTSLGKLGQIEREDRALEGEADGRRLRLALEGDLLVVDPRVSLRTADRVLRLLAARGSASARDVARDLAISLRAAQGALSELSERQLCDRQKVGRNVAYVVEDTVFSEPSLRLRLDEVLG